MIVTYHFSTGDEQRGCRGFDCDKRAAMNFAQKLKQQFDGVFGGTKPYVVWCGVETDFESLILHGENGDVIDLANVRQDDNDSVNNMLTNLYPTMSSPVRNAFALLVAGNIQHTAYIRETNRPIEEAEHREWVLAVGRGLDWLREPNTALIVGPFHPDLSIPLTTAANLLLNNVRKGRTNGEGVVLMSAAPYRDQGVNRRAAVEKALYLGRLSGEIICQNVPELCEHLNHLVGVVNMHTRQFEVIEA